MISITKTVVTMGLLLVPSTLAVALEPRNTGDPIWFTMKIWSTNVNTKVIPTKHIDTTVPDSQTGFESYQGSSPEPVFQIPQGQTDKQYIVGQLNFFMMPSEPRGVALLDVPGLDDPSKQVQCQVSFTEDPGVEDIDWFLRQAAPNKLTIECDVEGVVG